LILSYILLEHLCNLFVFYKLHDLINTIFILEHYESRNSHQYTYLILLQNTYTNNIVLSLGFGRIQSFLMRCPHQWKQHKWLLAFRKSLLIMIIWWDCENSPLEKALADLSKIHLDTL